MNGLRRDRLLREALGAEAAPIPVAEGTLRVVGIVAFVVLLVALAEI